MNQPIDPNGLWLYVNHGGTYKHQLWYKEIINHFYGNFEECLREFLFHNKDFICTEEDKSAVRMITLKSGIYLRNNAAIVFLPEGIGASISGHTTRTLKRSPISIPIQSE